MDMLSSSNNNNNEDTVIVYDGSSSKKESDEELKSLFLKYCNTKEGLLTKDELYNIPSIAQLLADEDLLDDELNDIWIKSCNNNNNNINVDTFIQIYRDIDDLFEDDDDDDVDDDV